MRATVVKRVSFEAAHFLPNYDGPCQNMHGHHWVVEVGFSGVVDESTGILIDFSIIKRIISPLIESFDHHLLNDTIPNPTAENISNYIREYLVNERMISRQTLTFVRVWETEDSYAEVRNE